MTNPRSFNEVKIKNNFFIKKSKNKQKLIDESNWYLSIPEELSIFIPQVRSLNIKKNHVELVLEKIEGKDLSTQFVNDENFDVEKWKKIMKDLFFVHNFFKNFKKKITQEQLRFIYYEKTLDRIKKIEFNMKDSLTINGIDYYNFKNLEKKIIEFSYELWKNSIEGNVIHGDFCLSNILNSDGVKLVDPRGRTSIQTIYGDPRYDIAKLRHSFVGLYDFIINDKFNLKEVSHNKFEMCIDIDDVFAEKIKIEFDKLLMQNNYDLNEIKFIEALLFLTMIPLHSDYENRQKAFYLIAIKKFNEVLL